ncbi:hypothetical protein BURPS305_1727 [Burkholderia pseudomallei 305]|nr:hypothetical protein BURPS305_1727 [Burkholderia pseudomallei 305]
MSDPRSRLIRAVSFSTQPVRMRRSPPARSAGRAIRAARNA